MAFINAVTKTIALNMVKKKFSQFHISVEVELNFVVFFSLNYYIVYFSVEIMGPPLVLHAHNNVHLDDSKNSLVSHGCEL